MEERGRSGEGKVGGSGNTADVGESEGRVVGGGALGVDPRELVRRRITVNAMYVRMCGIPRPMRMKKLIKRTKLVKSEASRGTREERRNEREGWDVPEAEGDAEVGATAWESDLLIVNQELPVHLGIGRLRIRRERDATLRIGLRENGGEVNARLDDSQGVIDELHGEREDVVDGTAVDARLDRASRIQTPAEITQS